MVNIHFLRREKLKVETRLPGFDAFDFIALGAGFRVSLGFGVWGLGFRV